LFSQHSNKSQIRNKRKKNIRKKRATKQQRKTKSNFKRLKQEEPEIRNDEAFAIDKLDRLAK
jgi:hypothetical protein